MAKQLPLRPNVCMLVFNREGKLFLGERAGKGGCWQFPQGGVESQISLEENVFKELGEELGLKRKQIGRLVKLTATHSYDWDKVPGYAKGKWRGQAQTFWLIEFIGEDKNIDLCADEEQELQSWKWCTPEQVRKLAEAKRLPGYEAALLEFEELVREGGLDG